MSRPSKNTLEYLAKKIYAEEHQVDLSFRILKLIDEMHNMMKPASVGHISIDYLHECFNEIQRQLLSIKEDCK